jgi:hypothetical protein
MLPAAANIAIYRNFRQEFTPRPGLQNEYDSKNHRTAGSL